MTEDIFAAKQGTELFSKVYGYEISENLFYHKHFENPDALPVPFIIEVQDEAPVAMRWLMKSKFLYNNETLSGVQSSDDAVLNEARGLLFLKMRKKTLAILQQESIDFEYGCFYPGNAMEIAEKFGEKNVANLYMARLLLNEKTHHWKRFDINIPMILRKTLFNRRKNILAKLSRSDIQISVDKQCPFNGDDYTGMNTCEFLHIERSDAYYTWKTSSYRNLLYITARKDSQLCGFLIIKKEADHGIIADWDAFGENKVGTLASMLLSVCNDYQYLDIPSLNIENGEMKLFTDLGCKDMSQLWAPICICARSLSDSVAPIIEKPENWKHRLIDTDYFLNGE